MFANIICWEVFVFLVCAGGIVAFQLLTGRINTRGLLRTEPNGPISPTRVQMLFTVASFALWYLDQVRLSSDYSSLPDVSDSSLVAFAGSQSAYLLGKGFTLLNWQQYLNKNN